MKAFCVCVLAVVAVTSRAQLTLEGCKEAAMNNYPAIKQYDLIEQSRDYTVSNAAKGWLPQVSVTAGALAFTDIIDMESAGNTAFDMDNYLYGAGIIISQKLYDSSIAANQRTARTQAEVSREQMNVTMYDINSRVEQIFFSILVIDEQIGQNALLQEDLSLSKKTVESMIAGGMATQSDADAITVEIIRAKQQRQAMDASRKAWMAMLSAFVGEALGADVTLERPIADKTVLTDNRRPELAYYAAKNKLLDVQRSTLDAKLMPVVSAFGMGTYHSKPVGMVSSSMIAGGVTLSWNIGALYTRKNDIRNIETQRESIAADRETFLFNTGMQSRQTEGNIESIEEQIALDDEIITLRESIKLNTEKKLTGGTETVNELLRAINAVNEARRNKVLHEIQLIEEIYKLKTINDN